LASSRTATSAVTADGLTGSPRSSMTKTRSASPSKASRCRRLAADGLLQVDQVGRVQRVGLVVGEGAVELEVQRDDVERQPVEDHRHGVPAHAVAGVDDDAQRADAERSTRERRCAAYSDSRSRWLTSPVRPGTRS
jgi:hypothetical protein